MSLLFIDGFDDELWDRGKWSTVNAAVLTTGRNGNGLQTDNFKTVTKQVASSDEHATLIVGAAVKVLNARDRRVAFIAFLSDGMATGHIGIVANDDGTLSATRGDGTSYTVLGTTAQALVLDQWYHLEVKATLGDTTGSVVIRVNGAVWLELTNVDTKNGGTKTVLEGVRLGSGSLFSSSWQVVFDDVYLLNGAGTAYNDFLGDMAVETIFPAGNGNSSLLVGSDGNSVDNYLLVDEAEPDSTDYVGSATSGDKDTYVFGDLSRASGVVKGVQVAMWAAKTDSGARSMRAVTRTGAVDYAGGDQALATGYLPYLEVWETNPGTAADWTIAEVNAAEFGAEVRP